MPTEIEEERTNIDQRIDTPKVSNLSTFGPIENINLANEIKEKLFSLGYTTSHLVMN